MFHSITISDSLRVSKRTNDLKQAWRLTCLKKLMTKFVDKSCKNESRLHFPPIPDSFRFLSQHFEFLFFFMYLILFVICIVSMSTYYLMTQSVFRSKLIEYYLRSRQSAVSMLPCTDWFLLATIGSHRALFYFMGNNVHLLHHIIKPDLLARKLRSSLRAFGVSINKILSESSHFWKMNADYLDWKTAVLSYARSWSKLAKKNELHMAYRRPATSRNRYMWSILFIST